MRIYVKAMTRSHKNAVEKIAQNEYRVRTTAVPERGKANNAIVTLLSKYFRVSKSAIHIIGGATASKKIIDIEL